MNKRIWIVGGSSGIGLELVKLWLIEEHRVIVSARHASDNELLQALKEIYPDTLELVDMDVAETGSIAQAVSKAWDVYDGIDIWFYNAGAYETMKVKEWKYEHFRQMNTVNYLGAVNLMTELYPLFEKQGHGRWVFNLSLSAYIGLPYGGGYSAPKAALLNLSESIQPELMEKNIRLQIINHGFVKTRLTSKNDFEMPQLMEPEAAAKKIFEGLKKPYAFEIRFPFGLSLFLRVLKLLPYRLSLFLTKKAL
jgi:NAD(P)-dependent dehydrogenase (short-subunit alcohol dehydrogenase family)